MARKGSKITKTKVDQMWKLYAEGFSMLSISRACSVTAVTVRKYRETEKWIDRRNKIIERAEAKADDKQVSLLAENMKIVRFAKGKLVEQIKAVAEGGDVSKSPLSDLDKLIRLEEFLHGRPDSRPQLDYSKMSEEELTIELQTTVEELAQIPECKQELEKLLGSGTD